MSYGTDWLGSAIDVTDGTAAGDASADTGGVLIAAANGYDCFRGESQSFSGILCEGAKHACCSANVAQALLVQASQPEHALRPGFLFNVEQQG